MSRVFWDTNLFIYLFEDYGPLSKTTAALRTKMLARGDQLLTSTLTLGEILVKPTEQGDMQLCSRYETAITVAVLILPFDAQAARIYASLRSDRALRPPDAIQLASAAGQTGRRVTAERIQYRVPRARYRVLLDQ